VALIDGATDKETERAIHETAEEHLGKEQSDMATTKKTATKKQAVKKTTADQPYYARRSAGLKAQNACTTCGTVKGTGRKAQAKDATFSRAKTKELADAPSWKRRLAAMSQLNACYACGVIKGTGKKVGTNGGTTKAEPKTAAAKEVAKRANQLVEVAEAAKTARTKKAAGTAAKDAERAAARKTAIRKAKLGASVAEAVADANAALEDGTTDSSVRTLPERAALAFNGPVDEAAETADTDEGGDPSVE
jgi:hypothetical protein